MSKHEILTKVEVSKCKLEDDVLDVLEYYSKEEKRDKASIKILDWGCGRGLMVAKLLELGYNAFGVDIDDLPIDKAHSYFKSIGNTPIDILSKLEPNNRVSFPDEYFDLVISEQVFEHVENLSEVAKEMSRITKKGGLGIHHYPAKWGIMEGHLFQPFVFLLPKNNLRFLAIMFFTIIGVEPKWKELEGKSKLEKAQVYYQYSISKTFYRSVKEVSRIFRSYNFKVDFVAIEYSKFVKNKIVKSVMEIKILRKLYKYFLDNFVRHNFKIEKL